MRSNRAMKFPPDLIARVRFAVHRAGYCFLAADEIRRVVAAAPRDRGARYEALREFAQICGAEMETTPHLTSARFVPAKPSPAVSPPAGYPLFALARA
jgi:hypothetical protein